MKIPLPAFQLFNGNILLMEWAAKIDLKQTNKIAQFAAQLRNQSTYNCTDVVPAYNSLTLYFKDIIVNPNELIDNLTALYLQISDEATRDIKLWNIPVVYGGIYGPDLNTVCGTLKMDIEELITRHSAPVYDVHFIGFLPGFPYLGGLDPALHIARKSIPSGSINPGAVAIGGSQTGIYPLNSPGGWHVIGQTPFPLFDIKRTVPVVIKGKDQIKFFPIKPSEIEDYRQQLHKEIAGIYEH